MYGGGRNKMAPWNLYKTKVAVLDGAESWYSTESIYNV